jgi:drug/metabolite transporter (DMT)-like permease
MIMGFEKPYLDRAFGWIRIFGLSCALGGAAYILFGSISSSQSSQSRTDTTLGYTFFLINTAAAAIFINFQKPLLHMCAASSCGILIAFHC